ncbi:hypothetical protein [Sutcliffiella halmapala]|uniref:hypothetical protein n=1 Tax=Sutcliffiella halmapala TaxID=79882 RepID=UPI000995504B|nr:hypothetical protein [Sutcliffiella halmapala]
MKSIKVLILFFLLTLFSLPFASTSFACSCLPPGSPSQELDKSDAVFTGEVTGIKGKYNSTVEAKINVKESWKGIDATEVTVYTANDSASCGIDFEVGKEYIIYAYLEDGNYTTYLCTRTAELSYAQEDIKELGEGSTPTKKGDTSANSPSTQNLVVGSVGLVLVLGGCFFYRWKSMKVE